MGKIDLESFADHLQLKSKRVHLGYEKNPLWLAGFTEFIGTAQPALNFEDAKQGNKEQKIIEK